MLPGIAGIAGFTGASVGLGPSGSINLDFIGNSYSSAGNSYGSLAAYLSGTGSTFVRATSATYFNSSGVLSSASSNTARFNHDPANSNAALGLLIEPAATNRAGDTEDFSVGSSPNTTITTNAAAAPDGNTTADKIAEDTTSNVFHQWERSALSSINLNTVMVWSAFIKSVERSKGTLLLSNNTAANFLFHQFDLSALTIGVSQTAGSGWTATASGILDVGGSWRRIWIAGSYNANNTVRHWIETNNAAAARQYAGSIGSGFHAWGSQLETGVSAPTSYVPSSQGTRNADAFTIALPTGTHDLTYTFDDNTTQNVTGQTGSYAVPTNLNRRNIKSIVGTRTA